MFEDFKLKRYKNIIGFAYQELDKYMCYRYLKTYLVVYKKGYKFIPLKKFELITDLSVDEKIKELELLGYKHISNWIDYFKEQLEKEDNYKRLILKNSIDSNS